MAKQSGARSRKSNTRYARVKNILDTAAAGSSADYGGAGRFWDRSLDEFKNACVFGVRMVALAAAASCCGDGEARSARSGLIKGLRGEPPFDNGQFPPLMWGGKRVPDPDIAFIADWIDDGCPDDDHLQTIDLGPLEGKAGKPVKLSEVAEFEAFATGAKRYAYREGEPRQRANLDCLTEAQVDELRDTFRTIYRLDKDVEDRRNYNNQALIHQNHCQHGWERFLPWHRAYLYEFEQNLQDFAPDIMLPYWDWTMPHYRPEDPTRGCIIPPAFKAFLTEDQAEWLIGRLDPKPTKTAAGGFRALGKNRTLFVSQHAFFCHVISEIGYTDVTPAPQDRNRDRMIDALLESNALWYPLRYPADYGGGTINSVIHYHYPTVDDMAQIMRLNNFRDFGGGSVYDAAFGFLDQNPHNTMHIWTGGMNPEFNPNDGSAIKAYVCKGTSDAAARVALVPAERRNSATRIRGRAFHRRKDLYSQPSNGDMFSNLTASYDPIFWPIHVNIDRIWWDWQTRNPTGLPGDLDAVLSPWSYTIRDMLDIARFGYEYVRCSFFMPVGIEAPVGRFVSKPIKIYAQVKKFRRAEIRLHWVPQLLRSCFVRVFLNDPGANATTPVRDNPHYAGYLAIFGHGECYGGPGHCDLPPPRARAYDQRPRSHNTPRNHRIDVTETARKLLGKTSALQITLLVIGADYREERDLLRLEGVSLNFLD
jgi:tyrosinase